MQNPMGCKLEIRKLSTCLLYCNLGMFLDFLSTNITLVFRSEALSIFIKIGKCRFFHLSCFTVFYYLH